MKGAENLELIKQALFQTLNEKVEISEDTDLIGDEIVDSLDSSLFLFELESLAKVKIPQAAVEEGQLLKIQNLVQYLNEKRN